MTNDMKEGAVDVDMKLPTLELTETSLSQTSPSGEVALSVLASTTDIEPEMEVSQFDEDENISTESPHKRKFSELEENEEQPSSNFELETTHEEEAIIHHVSSSYAILESVEEGELKETTKEDGQIDEE
jgi:hypothetical protein